MGRGAQRRVFRWVGRFLASTGAVSRFWYSAYRDFTVDQIERNARIACGLRKETMSEQEAAAWARDL